jgi:hypothetical protein
MYHILKRPSRERLLENRIGTAGHEFGSLMLKRVA